MDDGTDQADGSSNQNLKCDYCPMSFSDLPKLESHQESHKEDRPYKCNQCDKSYRHAGSLVNHKKTHQIGLYTCLICQKEYSNPMGLKSHLRTHSEEKRFKCEQCGEAFRMSQQLYNHRKSLHGYCSTTNGEKITRSPKFEVQSPVLVESSNLMSNLENYIAESMLPVDFPQLVSKYYPEEKTRGDSPTKEDVEGHEEFTDEKDQPNDSNTEEYRYKCTQCDKAYKHAGSLANHRQSHMVGVYQCAVCYKEFSNLMAMKNHCRLHSDSRARRSCKSPRSSRKSDIVHRDTPDSPQIEALQSPEKGNNPPGLPELSENINSKEDQDTIPIPQNYYQDELASPGSPLTKPNHDDVTDASFSSDSVVENTKEDETQEKANDFLAEQTEYDDAHEEDVKLGDRLFKCQECGKTYRHAGSLINHKKTHQTGVYSCSLCSKQMFNMAALKNHLRAHFKSRAGKRLSDASFSSVCLSDELYQNQEDSYQCGVCDDITTNENDFMQHQLLHHKQKIHEICNDKQVEEAPELGSWQETPHGSSDDSAYSSGPGFPDVKIEMDNLTLQQRRQDNLVSTPHKVKLESGDADVQNAEASFEHPNPEPIADPESSFVEEHHQSTDHRPYKCDLCGRTYRHNSSLINHKLTHKTGVYQCSLCPKQYSNLMALRNHVRFHSRSYAGRFFRTKPRFLQNRNSHSLGSSVKLNKATTSNRDVEEHSDESQSLCPCGKSFDCSEHFQTHKKSCPSAITVSPEKTTADTHCETSITIKSELSKVKEPVEHKEMVVERSQNKGRRVYECDLCSKSYRHSGSLINHKRTHQTGDYMCPYCTKHVHNMAALKNHIRIHHKAKKGQQGELRVDHALLFSDPSYPPTGKGLYSCVSCEEMFHTENELLAHQMVHVSLEGNQWDLHEPKSSSPEIIKENTFRGTGDCDWDYSNNLSCQDEHKRFDSEKEDEQPEYTCVECGEVYDNLDDLNDHKHSHQAGIYQCSFCPKEYPNLLALRSHFETHTKPQAFRNTSIDGSDENEYKDEQLPADNHYDCGHCGLIFSNEVDFHQHQVAHEKQVLDESLPVLHSDEQVPEFLSMHSSERELLCRIKSEIEETERSEANDGGSLLSHICGFCGKTYDDLESLQAHSFSHSNEEETSANEDPHPKTEMEENPQQHSPILKEVEGTEQPEYTCVECGEVYDHLDDLNDHKHSHQAGIYQCSFCPKEYPNLLALRSHFETHTKPQAFRNTSIDGSDGNEYMDEQLLADNHYDCGNCGLIFSNEVDFHQHQVAHEKQVLDESLPVLHSDEQVPEFLSMHSAERELLCRIKSEIEETERSEANDGGFLLSHICGFCGKTYDDLESLQAHSFSHSNEEETSANEDPHPKTEMEENPQQHSPILKEVEGPGSASKNEESPESRPYTCEQCGKTYRHGGSLVNHKKTHLVGNFQCVSCSRHYHNLAAYRTHLRHHPKCKQPAAFTNQQALQALQDSIYPSRDEKPLTFSSSPGCPMPDGPVGLHSDKKCAGYSSIQGSMPDHPTSQCYSQTPLNNKNSRRRFSRRAGRNSEHQASKLLNSAVNVSGVQDKKIQVCEFCGKVVGIKDLAVHLSGSCGGHTTKGRNGHKEEVEDVPVYPDFTLSQNVDESGFSRRPFRCEVCGRTYRHAGSLINHKQTHKTGIFRCSICQKGFFNLMAMKNHNRIHFELKRHKCIDCGKAFRLQKQLDTHQRIHWQRASARKLGRRNRKNRYRRFSQGHYQKSLMQVSGKGSSSYEADDKTSVFNTKKEKDPDSRPYQCEECGRSYRHAGSLFNHKKSHKMGQYHCSICDKTYSNLMALKNHQRTHYEAKRHPCPQCGKTFKWKRQLFRHQLIHLRDGSQSVPEIPLGTQEAKNLDCHQENHDTSNINYEGISKEANKISHDSSESTSQLKPVCVSCGISFTNCDELKSHVCKNNCTDALALGDHGTDETTQSENKDDRPHRCDICSRTYRHASSLHTHKLTHKRGNYKCGHCHKVFLNPIALKAHLRTHSTEKRFQCVDCGQTFRSSQELKSHNTVHKEEKSFYCSTCNRGFSCQLTLRHHQRTHKPLSSQSSSIVLPTQTNKMASKSGVKFQNHKDQGNQGDRKYKCKQCGRSYLHASSLFTHQKTHNIGIYKCPDCLKIYSNLLAFKNHLRIHRYSCKECGKAFRNSSDLVVHSKIHQEGCFTCLLCDKQFLCRSSFEQHQRIHSNQDGDILDPQTVSNFMVEVT